MAVKKAGVIGLGLLGGSIAKALKLFCGVTDIVAYDRDIESVEAALLEGAISRYTLEINGDFADCDVIFICTPVHLIASQAAALSPFVNRDCIVTDVGSAKARILREMSDTKAFCFIGGHPMTGSEKSGYTAATEYLFQQTHYILTPYPHTPPDKLTALRDIITSIGAVPLVMPPETHDHIAAAISHVPHVIAAALVNTVRQLDINDQPFRLLAAGGFKDITRIASASPALWEAISTQNAEEIVGILEGFEAQLRQFKELLLAQKEAPLYDFYKDAKSYRDSLPPFEQYDR